ncbi:hypothetical protein BQ8794_150054 [Mesorhizobium prunaredense]|uniref:Uncharacterized protein n=1 Tax=Mesorhizobium prunaredense TaxID=1631249 RepID=A0A1R3V380_9HYPH|nr:hypothetical protein BQ8794_150054 [Mesorhizobium prunaredense]
MLRFRLGRVGVEDGREATKLGGFREPERSVLKVREHRKRRKLPFAGRHHLNIEHPICR